jgi:tetratricopeptide (TPR) repeat protein
MVLHRIVGLMLLTGSLCLASQAQANMLQKIRFGQHGALSRVVFDLQQEASYRLEPTDDPLTLRIVFTGLSLTTDPQVVRSSSPLIQEVRLHTSASEVIGDIILKQPGTVQHKTQMRTPARVVLDIAQRQDHQPGKGTERQTQRGGDKEAERPPGSAPEHRDTPAPSRQTKVAVESHTTAASTPAAAAISPAPAPSRMPQVATVPAPAPLTATQLLERAEKQWAAQQVSAAQQSYTTFLQRYPEHPSNHLIVARLADILHAQEHYREALEAYTAVLQGYPGTEGAIISHIRLAELGAARPDLLPPGNEARYTAYRQPLPTLRRLASEYAFSPLADVARFKIGEILARQSDLPAALETFQQLLRRPLQEALRRDVETGLRQALAQLLATYQQQGAFVDVLRTFFAYKPSLAAAETGHPDLLYAVVTSYAHLGLFDEAQSLLPPLLATGTTLLPRTDMLLALARLFATSDRPGVVTALLTPVEQFSAPTLRGQALLLLAGSAWRTQRPDDVVRYGKMGQNLLATPTERSALCALLGQAYEAQGEPVQAAQAFQACAEGAEAGEMTEMCLLRAAGLYLNQGQAQSALPLYERVLSLFPHSSSKEGVLWRLAEIYRQQPDRAQMQATLTRLREGTPETFWPKLTAEYLAQAEWQERLHERLAIFQNTLLR